jgi:hypothetical protein
MTASRPRLQDRPTPKGLRRVERWLVGLVMGVLAYVIEKAVLRSIRKGTTKPKPQEATAISGTGAEIVAD